MKTKVLISLAIALAFLFVFVFSLPRYATVVYQGTRSPYLMWNDEEAFIFVTEKIGFNAHRVGAKLIASIIGTGAQTGSFGTLRTDLIIFHIKDGSVSKHVVKDSSYSLPFPLKGKLLAWRDSRLYCWTGTNFMLCSEEEIGNFNLEWQSAKYKMAKSRAQFAGYNEADWSFSKVGVGKQKEIIWLEGLKYVVGFERGSGEKSILGVLYDEKLTVMASGNDLIQSLWKSGSEQLKWVQKSDLKRQIGQSAEINNMEMAPLDPTE